MNGPPNPKFGEVATTTERSRDAAPKPKPKFGKKKVGFPAKPTRPVQPTAPQPQTQPQQATAPIVPPAVGKAPPIGGGETQGAVDRSAHFKGNPGFAEGRHEKNQSFHDEQHEHWGDKTGSGSPQSGSKMPHASQPQGHSIGVPPLGSGQQGSFGSPHTFRGMRGNPTPSSGHSGAHRIGKRR